MNLKRKQLGFWTLNINISNYFFFDIEKNKISVIHLKRYAENRAFWRINQSDKHLSGVPDSFCVREMEPLEPPWKYIVEHSFCKQFLPQFPKLVRRIDMLLMGFPSSPNVFLFGFGLHARKPKLSIK